MIKTNTLETKFRAGSLTKAFTAAAVLFLQQQGKLNPEDTIDKLIEDFSSGQKISIHQLLNHTSGVADFTFSSNYWRKLMRLPASQK